MRGTTAAEEFEIERLKDGSVTVAIYARETKSGERAPHPYFRRTFLPDETSEIRVYTTGGNDRVVEQGNGTGAILLRVISPPGTSELVDRSNQASAAKLYEPLPLPRIPKKQLARALEHDAQAEERRAATLPLHGVVVVLCRSPKLSIPAVSGIPTPPREPSRMARRLHCTLPWRIRMLNEAFLWLSSCCWEAAQQQKRGHPRNVRRCSTSCCSASTACTLATSPVGSNHTPTPLSPGCRETA